MIQLFGADFVADGNVPYDHFTLRFREVEQLLGSSVQLLQLTLQQVDVTLVV